MTRIALGSGIRESTTVRDVTGALADPTTIALTILKPDGTTQTYAAPVHDSTGLYHQDIPPADMPIVGHYAGKWVTTGVAAGASPADPVDVYDPLEPEVLSLADLKTQLNITTTTNDAELARYAATAVLIIETILGGPVLNRTVSETVYATDAGQALVLRQQGLVSVTSIVDQQSGVSMDVSQLIIDANARVVRQKFFRPFWYWGPFTVTYVAGQGTSVTEDTVTAAAIITQHLWDTRRGPVIRPQLGGEDLVVTSAGYAIPRRAMELLQGNAQEAVVS
jgi:hypothetical protein